MKYKKLTSLWPAIICVFCAIAFHASGQPGPNYKQFGSQVVDVSKPNKLKLTYLCGTINWVHDGIVGLDIYKTTFYADPATGNAAIGAYSAGGRGHSVKEYDRTVAITNFTDLNNATISKEITINAMRIGTLTVQGDPLEFYDCGKPYIPPPPTQEQIEATKAAATATATREKIRKQERDAIAVKGLLDLATNGNAAAQYSLGLRYLNGRGCETNKEQAIFWLQKAAAQGDAEASNKLSELKSP